MGGLGKRRGCWIQVSSEATHLILDIQSRSTCGPGLAPHPRSYDSVWKLLQEVRPLNPSLTAFRRPSNGYSRGPWQVFSPPALVPRSQLPLDPRVRAPRARSVPRSTPQAVLSVCAVLRLAQRGAEQQPVPAALDLSGPTAATGPLAEAQAAAEHPDVGDAERRGAPAGGARGLPGAGAAAGGELRGLPRRAGAAEAGGG